MKEAENVRCPDVTMNPITWQVEQVTEKLGQLATANFFDLQPLMDISDILSSPLKAKWEVSVPLPVGRNACTAVSLHGSVYVGSGLEGNSAYEYQISYRLDVYNLSTNQWSPSPITTPYHAYDMTVLDDKLVTVGGVTKSDKFTNKILFLDAGQWKDYSEMPTARGSVTAVGHEDMLIVAGGKADDVDGTVIKVCTTELLDTTNGCWYTCDNLPTPHSQLKPTVVNNTLYMLGGSIARRNPSSQVFSASLEKLSTHQLKWQSLTDTPWHFSHPVGLYNKFLLIVGGRHPADVTVQSSEVHAFNSSTGLWELITNIPVPTSGPAVVSVADNKIIVLGGSVGSKQRLISTNVWIGTFE